jgi:AcrR family transcriptional regulator
MKEKITRTGIKQSVKELIKSSPQPMLTVKNISLATGISRTSFYASFENLEDVLLELQEDFMDEIYELYFSYQDSLALHKLFEYLSENKELILFLFHPRYAEQWMENAQAIGQKITIQSLKTSDFPITDMVRECISIIVNGCIHRIARHLEQGEWDHVYHVLLSTHQIFATIRSSQVDNPVHFLR